MRGDNPIGSRAEDRLAGPDSPITSLSRPAAASAIRALIAHKAFLYRHGMAVTETFRHDLRLCGTRGTILLLLLGAWPRGRRCVRA